MSISASHMATDIQNKLFMYANAGMQSSGKHLNSVNRVLAY